MWTEHKASSGRPFWYNRSTGISTWNRPESDLEASLNSVDMSSCLGDPLVAKLLRAILQDCGWDAIPTVRARRANDALCADGRGGAFCCASSRIYLCTESAWVGCREIAYELSHALNVCRGTVRCAPGGMELDGRDCGYFSPPDLACSEYKAAFWTHRCAGRTNSGLRECLEWHSRWAVSTCFPEDDNLEAHVRWARHSCTPKGRDRDLTKAQR
eukprot:CAMPEP_0119309042 /NCGR_PEP_ID=MMETSP1333-20130426/13765_1 /TAXON_ID=418940 /ORGANISM="Scyphosphaera apsteinii, Strain RCC1455" /LENGTH=213 /DNA_ID=CAMNT_0007312947 /DNA_START=90 /DNA_END=731 /DNA_ORIENTATION=+